MVGVHSPCDAFVHLQRHQHSGLLGPSMQVRGHSSSLTSSTAHCNLCQCMEGPTPPRPILYINPMSFMRLCSLLVLLGCLAPSTTLAWAVLHPRLSWLPLSAPLVSLHSLSLIHLVQNYKKLSQARLTCVKRIVEASCLSTVWYFEWQMHTFLPTQHFYLRFLCAIICCFCSWCSHSEAAISPQSPLRAGGVTVHCCETSRLQWSCNGAQ